MKTIKLIGITVITIITTPLSAQTQQQAPFLFENNHRTTVWITDEPNLGESLTEKALAKHGAHEVRSHEQVAVNSPSIFIYTHARDGVYKQNYTVFQKNAAAKAETSITTAQATSETPALTDAVNTTTTAQKTAKVPKNKVIAQGKKTLAPARAETSITPAHATPAKKVKKTAQKRVAHQKTTAAKVTEAKATTVAMAKKNNAKKATNHQAPAAKKKNESTSTSIANDDAKIILADEDNYDEIEQEEVDAQENIILQEELDTETDETAIEEEEFEDAPVNTTSNQNNTDMQNKMATQNRQAAPETTTTTLNEAEDVELNIAHATSEVKRVKRQRSPIRK